MIPIFNKIQAMILLNVLFWNLVNFWISIRSVLKTCHLIKSSTSKPSRTVFSLTNQCSLQHKSYKHVNSLLQFDQVAQSGKKQMWSSGNVLSNFGGIQILGCLLMMLVTGLNSMAGLGGGGTNVVILILFFQMLPKNATMIVFACIFGASFGNMINQMRRAIDGQAVINYRYTSITIPLMFAGTIFGVYLNQLLPTIVTATVILGVNISKLPQIFNKFNKEYDKESQEMTDNGHHSNQTAVMEQERVNPFDDCYNVRVFEQLLLLIVIYVVLEFLKGSFQFHSILGIRMCSLPYWIIEGLILIAALAFFYNSLIIYRERSQSYPSELEDSVSYGSSLNSTIKDHETKLILNSSFAGILSGFGLGGGIILVPLYRDLGLNPVQASSTSSFTVFVASGINVIQALFLGVISITEFFLYFTITCIGSYFISVYLGQHLRKTNRTSIIDLIVIISTLILLVCLPFSLWYNVSLAGGNTAIIFSLGTTC